MTTGIDVHDETLANPLDLMELVAGGHGWSYDRATDQDMSLEVVGHWCDYRMFLTWHHEVGALLFACAYDIKVPTHKRNEISALLAMINEKMLLNTHRIMMPTKGKKRKRKRRKKKNKNKYNKPQIVDV